jgi:predicted ABC-type transport system involved in lysophospholipase L1 biosynthesis ATPase subunit
VSSFMRDVWTSDDLLFAVVRSLHPDEPRQVADDLLAAADEPVTRLREIPASGGALVLATHDPEVAERCDQVLDLSQPAVASGRA